MFHLQPITEQDVLDAFEASAVMTFPQDESGLAALYNFILEKKLIDSVPSEPRFTISRSDKNRRHSRPFVEPT